MDRSCACLYTGRGFVSEPLAYHRSRDGAAPLPHNRVSPPETLVLNRNDSHHDSAWIVDARAPTLEGDTYHCCSCSIARSMGSLRSPKNNNLTPKPCSRSRYDSYGDSAWMAAARPHKCVSTPETLVPNRNDRDRRCARASAGGGFESLLLVFQSLEHGAASQAQKQ